jgi:hypothetical protein
MINVRKHLPCETGEHIAKRWRGAVSARAYLPPLPSLRSGISPVSRGRWQQRITTGGTQQ